MELRANAGIAVKRPKSMASDLVWWYRETGQELHEDTRMFAVLPKPWDVISGAADLTRSQVLLAASELGVDAEKSGWVGPRAPQAIEQASPEPALVHGVVVSDPQLARTLRRCGVFDAKDLARAEELPDTVKRGYLIDVDHNRVVPLVLPATEPAAVADNE